VETVYQRALEGYEKALGQDIIGTYIPALNTQQYLNLLLAALDEPEEALQYCQRALDGLQQVLGPSHERCSRLSVTIESLSRGRGATSPEDTDVAITPVLSSSSKVKYSSRPPDQS
jgi:tetratricopeptide (TPR) repeat protein